MILLQKIFDRFNILVDDRCIGCILKQDGTWTYDLEQPRPPTVTLEYLDCVIKIMND